MEIRNSILLQYGIPGRAVVRNIERFLPNFLHIHSNNYVEYEYDLHFDIRVRNSVLSAGGTEIRTDSINPHTSAMVTKVFVYTHKLLHRIPI